MAKKRGHSPEDDDGAVDDENRENGSYEEENMEAEEEDHDDDGGRRSRRKKKKKAKKFGIMTNSSQSEAERRVLRRRQRELNSEIAMGAGAGETAANGGDEGEEGDVDELTRIRGKNNELWDKVHYTREAVLDSENVDLIASKAAREAEKLVQVPRYDAVRLAQSLVKKGSAGTGSSSQFNWRGLGFQVGVCFNSLPSHCSFLYGPLDAEYAPKERKKAERRKKSQEDVEMDELEGENPEDVDQTGKKKSDGNELSAVGEHIKVISSTLMRRHKEEHENAKERSKEYASQLSQDVDDTTLVLQKKRTFIQKATSVDAVNCLFNPKSFTQTVENVFHFSFLIKDGFAGIKKRSAEEAEEFGGDPGPAIKSYERNDRLPDPRQAIVSLNMKDWRDMCNAYEVEESEVPHRVDGKVAKKEKKAKKSKHSH